MVFDANSALPCLMAVTSQYREVLLLQRMLDVKLDFVEFVHKSVGHLPLASMTSFVAATVGVSDRRTVPSCLPHPPSSVRFTRRVGPWARPIYQIAARLAGIGSFRRSDVPTFPHYS